MEFSKTVGRVIKLNGRDLPNEMQRNSSKCHVGGPMQIGRQQGGAPQEHGRCREQPKPRLGGGPELERSGFYANQRIVLLVLVRVDRVVVQSPGHAARIQKNRGPVETS